MAALTTMMSSMIYELRFMICDICDL